MISVSLLRSNWLLFAKEACPFARGVEGPEQGFLRFPQNGRKRCLKPNEFLFEAAYLPHQSFNMKAVA